MRFTRENANGTFSERIYGRRAVARYVRSVPVADGVALEVRASRRALYRAVSTLEGWQVELASDRAAMVRAADRLLSVAPGDIDPPSQIRVVGRTRRALTIAGV